MNSVSILAGVLLIAATLWDVFNDLFHPSSHSAVGDWIARRLFNLLRRTRFHGAAGPLSVVTIILSWVLGLALGFGLVFSPGFPQQFLTSTGEVPADTAHFLTTLYFSFQTLITLGYGDLIPNSTPLRFIASAEALIGFGLLTASISSVVLLYPALARSRLLARTIAHFAEAERKAGLSVVQSRGESSLHSLTQQITQVRIDLIHFPVTYYFSVSNADVAISTWIFDAERFAREGMEDDEPKIRLAACALDIALEEYAAILAQRFLQHPPDGRTDIFKAFAADQCVPRTRAES